MKIVVTGAAGHVSRPLTELLLEKRHDVTVVGRNPKNLERLVRLGAKAAIGDLGDIPFLRPLVGGGTRRDGVTSRLRLKNGRFEPSNPSVDVFQRIGIHR